MTYLRFKNQYGRSETDHCDVHISSLNRLALTLNL